MADVTLREVTKVFPGGATAAASRLRSRLSPTSDAEGSRSASHTTPSNWRGPSGATTIEPGSTAMPRGTR